MWATHARSTAGIMQITFDCELKPSSYRVACRLGFRREERARYLSLIKATLERAAADVVSPA